MQFFCLVLLSIASIVMSFTHRSPVVQNPLKSVSKSKLGMISSPHGGVLVENIVKSEHIKNELIASCDFEIELNDRQLCDVELLMNGAFSPLGGFMDEVDYRSVVDNMTLSNGTPFGLPIVYDTNDHRVVPGVTLLLKHNKVPIATLKITSKYIPNKPYEALKCYGTNSLEHPGVQMISFEREKYYCGGKITGLNLPKRDFPCKTPAEVRAELPKDVDIVAFQCRNPIHRAHYELFVRSLSDPSLKPNSVVLVHPTCGPTQPDDIPGEIRFKTYEVLKDETANPRVHWAYLPYAMHMAGPREAIQHMIIRKNYGCTHFIIGRDMAGCKSSLTGEDFYSPYAAQDFAKQHGPSLGMTPLPSLNLVYTEEEGYVYGEYAKEKGLSIRSLSGTKFRQLLRSGQSIPTWFAFESVVNVLREEAMKKKN